MVNTRCVVWWFTPSTGLLCACACLCVCARACVRVCARAWMCVCVDACACVRARSRVHLCVGVPLFFSIVYKEKQQPWEPLPTSPHMGTNIR